MHLDVAVAKTRKYATPESGDTVEMIERPGGGLSFIVVDGQRSGKSAKAISNIVARKALTLAGRGGARRRRRPRRARLSVHPPLGQSIGHAQHRLGRSGIEARWCCRATTIARRW